MRLMSTKQQRCNDRTTEWLVAAIQKQICRCEEFSWQERNSNDFQLYSSQVNKDSITSNSTHELDPYRACAIILAIYLTQTSNSRYLHGLQAHRVIQWNFQKNVALCRDKIDVCVKNEHKFIVTTA